jgi:hypothetical protein
VTEHSKELPVAQRARHAHRQRVRLSWRRFVATLSATALLITGLVVIETAGATAAPGTITGTVFRDFNSNGIKDTAGGTAVAVDTGIAGVTVTGYDRDGASVGSTTTAASGNYTLNVTPAESNDVRVEFTTLPSGFKPSFRGTGNTGTRNLGATQFVQVGATGINFAANAPEDYSQPDPPIIAPIQRSGLPSNAGIANASAIVSVPWSQGFTTAGGQGATFPNLKTLATTSQVGAIWGTAYQGTTNSLYAAATYKRHAGLGPGGIGAIYRLTNVLGSNGAITTGTPGVTTWLNVQGKAIVGGGTVDVGTAQSNAARSLAGPTSPVTDVDAYQKAGKIGIGGLALSEDQKTLYFVNLLDRNLYSIDISDPVAAATTPVINKYNLGLTAAQRPWAVEVHGGYIYVGYVDSGEASAAGTSAASASMKAHVIRAAAATPGTWSSDLLNASLGYTKGTPAAAGTPSVTTFMNRWNAWTDLWSWTGGSVTLNFYGDPAELFPQPILSNLRFDSDGYVSLGFIDRGSLQAGNRNGSTTSTATVYQALSAGDILLAGQASNGTMTLENNGAVAGRTGSGTKTNAQGPGTGEFYNDQQALATGTIHQEITLGGLTGMAGVAETVSSAYDPLTEIRLPGLTWFSNTSGAPVRGYNLAPDGGATASPDGTFQKGGGLGDIQALSDDAPLQIGNRVWFDADQDGIQDADEAPIAGITVNLLQGATVIGTRTTNSLGEYYFSSTDSDLGGSFVAGGGDYTVQFIKPTTGTFVTGIGTGSWADASFTTANVGANAEIDSNAVPNGTDATKGEYVYTAGAVGNNNFSIDAGIVINGNLHVVKAIDPAGGVAEPGATYPITVSVTDFRGDSYSVGGDSSFSIGVGEANAHDVAIPFGATATVAESSEPTVRTSVLSPATPATIAGAGATRQSVVTVTNTLYLPGTFSVAKTVSGEGAGLVGASAPFTVEYTYAAITPTWKSMVVTRDGAAVASDPIPYGATVTIREVAPTTPTNVIWGTPEWTVNSISTTAATKTITIGDGTNVSVALNNPTTVERSGFSLTKSVTGSAADSVADTFSFTVGYSYVDLLGVTQTGTLNVTKAGATQTASLTNIPVGTEVTLTEVAPSGAPVDVSWGTPVWSSNVTTNGDGSATFTVGTSPISIDLENPTTRLLGGFSLTKSVTGSAASSVASAQEFVVTYTYPGQGAAQTLTVTKGSPTDSVGNLPYGTVVTLSEAAPTGAPADVSWGTPIWGATAGSLTDNGDGTVSFTVGATSVDVTLENPTTRLLGGFTLSKSVTGAAAASVANAQEFEVTYTYPGQGAAQTFTVTKGSPNASVTGLPYGTVVTLSEATPTGAPADVAWGSPVWTASAGSLTDNGDGTASFTIGATTVAVELENPTTRLYSNVTVTKSVTGSAASDVPGAFSFEIFYSYTDVAGTHSSSVTVTKASPTASLGSIPLGSVVSLSEGPRTGAPAVVGWNTPVWTKTGGGSLVDNGDGTAELTVSSTTAVAIGLENPTTQLLGGFSLVKSVTGSAAGSVAGSQEFVVTYTYPGQGGAQTLTVTKSSPNASVGSLPYGTVVTLSEATPTGAPADVSWGTPVWGATTGSLTDNGDGTVSFTIGATTVDVTLENPTTRLLGGFSLTKSVTGAAAGSVAGTQEFVVTYTYLGQGAAQTLTVTKASPSDSVSGLPYGTVVTLSEAVPTGAPVNVSWGTPVWTASAGSLTDNGDGTVSFTIGATTVAVDLENPANQLTGGFSLTKSVTGSAAGSVAGSQEFDVTYTYPGQGAAQTLTVTKASPSDAVSGLPYGTVVTLSEATPTGAPADVSWGTPVWGATTGSLTDNGDGTVSFTIGATTVDVTLENPTTRLLGGFSLTKSVTGAAAGSVAGTQEFVVTYTYPGQGAAQTLTVTKASPSDSVSGLPYGTVVTLSEATPTGAPADVEWGDPVWTATTGSLTDNGDGTASFTIGATTVAVALEDPANQLTGGFSVAKSVTGSAATSVAGSQQFVVTYTYPGQGAAQTLTVTKGSPSASVTSLPLGTVVTLSEAAPTGAPADVEWGDPVWTASGGSLTDNGDGTVSFTIGATTVAVGLENPTTRLLGGFSLTKSVTGSAASSVAGSQEFDVTYTYPGQGAAQTLTVTKASPSDSVTGLPYGTVVRLSEAAPTGAPSDVEWGDPVWTATTGSLTDNGDGTASFTIGATTVAVALENPTTRLLGGFSLTKSVTGAAAGSVAGSQEFDVTYTYPGQGAAETLTVTKASPSDSVTGLPYGTVVTVSEAAPTGAPSDVKWGDPVWTATTGSLTDNGDGTASFTIGATTVAVALENPTTRLYSDLTVTKSVTGAAAGAVPGGFSFDIFYSYTDSSGTHSSSVTVTKASPTASLGSIPVGSVVTLSEGSPSGAPAVVGWETPVWTKTGGGSLVDNGDGTAELTVSSTTAIAIGIENPTSQVLGGFTFEKSVTGSAQASVPDSFEFTVNYTYPGQAAAESFTVTKGSPTAAVGALPLGTVVTLSEVTPTGAAADVSWGTPAWTATDGSLTDNGDGTVSFTVAATTIAVALENPTTQRVASLSVTKSVTGAAAAAVAGAFEFTVNYSYTDSSGAHSGSVIVSKNAPTVSLGTVPVGSVVTLSEDAPGSAGPSVDWQTPLWTGTGGSLVDNGDGTATVTVSSTAAISVGLQNPTSQLLGDFTVTKAVTGSASASVADAQEFTVTYTYPGQPSAQTLVVTKGSPSDGVTGLPRGTIVTLSEAVPTGAPANVSWGTPTWSATGGALTDNGDGTVSFTVGATEVAVTLTNPTTELYGSFSITKDVTGPGAGGLASGFTFTGTYTYPGRAGGPGTYSLENGQTWTLPGGEQIPAGTVVTITEDTPSGGLAALRAWGDPIFSVGGSTIGTAASADITLGAGTTTAVGLENQTVIVPQVDIHKGDGSGITIVHEADTMGDAEYYAPSETRTIVFRVTNTGIEDLRDVELTDENFAGSQVSSLVWTFPDATTEAATRSGDTWSATWPSTFGAGTSVWEPGDVITGTATLTVVSSDAPHVDRASVNAVGATSGLPVTASNNYNAYSALVQIIHYDGNRADPPVKNAAGEWEAPPNPLPDVSQDANDMDTAVKYPAGEPQRVRWVITNIGTTYLTSLKLWQSASSGPQYSEWTCDMTPIGGTETAFNFVTDGAWEGLFGPQESFFCDGPLTLDADEVHQDTSAVVGTVVIPETTVDGHLTGAPTMVGGVPDIFRLPDGSPRTVTDSDPFNAVASLDTLASTGFSEESISFMVIVGVGGLVLGLVLMLIPVGRRRRKAQAES